MRTPAPRLAATTLELVDIASPSRDEHAIADHVEARLDAAGLGQTTVRRRNSIATVGAHSPGSDAAHVLLVGHLDTVPAQDNLPGRIDGDMIHGLGAADMKGALAVMLAIAEDLGDRTLSPELALDFVFYDREEVAVAESGLTPLLDELDALSRADLAIVMEPTGHTVQFGCLGNIDATFVYTGRAGHSARPWLADNAVHKGIRALQRIATASPHDDVIEGLTYREVAGVTVASGGHAANVVPDHFEVRVNLRYSPRRTPADAESLLVNLAGGADEVVVRSNSPGAMPCKSSPLVERLRTAGAGAAGGRLAAEPKQAWTDVAQFAARGIDAVNFGPGDPALAHARDERVEVAALVRAYETLTRFLTGPEPVSR
ncbi:MAG: succinyl-diaminopimelate desuccinylase [Acidimicrobiia bacterium]|nr:succinyl-diaminopimelate desuccinylase [Acidimicrobiia bacterium]